MSAWRLVWLGLLCGCSVELGPEHPWTPIGEVDGRWRPEAELERHREPAEGSIRVVSFNVAHGADVEGIAEAVEGTPALAAAGVLLLQEIEDHDGEERSRAARLAERLGMNHVYAPARDLDDGSGTHGLAILSRHPLADAEVMELPRAELSVRPRRRIALAASVELGERSLRVIDVHLDVRLSAAPRIEQLHPVVRTASDPVLVGGDLNTNPYLWLGVVPLLPLDASTDLDQAEVFDDCMRSQGFAAPTAEVGTTQNSGVARYRLDALYLRGARAGDAGAERSVALSDHVPVWADVSLE